MSTTIFIILGVLVFLAIAFWLFMKSRGSSISKETSIARGNAGEFRTQTRGDRSAVRAQQRAVKNLAFQQRRAEGLAKLKEKHAADNRAFQQRREARRTAFELKYRPVR